jgi:hypothetical protein
LPAKASRAIPAAQRVRPMAKSPANAQVLDENDDPLVRIGARHGRRARRMFWRNFAFSGGAAILCMALTLAARTSGVGSIGWLLGSYLAIAAAHVFVALPAQAARLALTVREEARGLGDAEGHHLHLLAIPGLPRPLYFHYWRAAMEPLGANNLAAIATASIFCWLALPVAVAFLIQQAAGALGPGPFQKGIAWWVPLVMLVYIPFLALPSVLLSRLAVSIVAGALGDLGDLAPLALAPKLSAADWRRAEERTELDEAWDGRGGGGAGRYLLEAAKRALAFLVALVAYPVAMFIALVGGFLVSGGGSNLERDLDAAISTLAISLLFFVPAAYVAARRFAAWARRKLVR